MLFPIRLKKLREERNLSQKDIADFLGITRQAVASYELAKREPDYDVLKNLADYFSVSVDYMLGRTSCKDANAMTIGQNIELIRGSFDYKELSQDIGKVTGAIIFPELLELYAKGERVPFAGTLRILAKYAGVHDSFFFENNTLDSYEEEKKLYKIEIEQNKANDRKKEIIFSNYDILVKWALKKENIEYLSLAKEIKEAGLKAEVLKPLIESIRKSNITQIKGG